MPVYRNNIPKTGGSITVPIGGNTQALVVNENDTTNNPNAVEVINAGNGDAIKLTALSTKYWLTGYVGATEYFGLSKKATYIELQGFTAMPLALNPQGNNVGVGGLANSIFHVFGPIATAITTTAKTGAYTMASTDSTVTGDTSGSVFTITLPTAVGCAGRQYTIKRVSAGANNLTVGTTSSQTIDGATTKSLGSQYSAITVQSDGANWQIVMSMGTVT